MSYSVLYMPLTKLTDVTTSQTNSGSKATKEAYSCYFQVRLNTINFGVSRKEHNRICNEQLLARLHVYNACGNQFHPDVSNDYLIEQIIASKDEAPGDHLFTWEHCSSSTAQGRMGVMRLVPSEQHRKIKGSEFWKTIHPDHGSRGGYYEWAVPAGAPANRSKTIYPVPSHINIETLKAEVLPSYFKMAVSANRYDQFEQLLKRADEVCSASQYKAIFDPHKNTGENLLHLACKNGYLVMINAIINRAPNAHELIHAQNACGNTPAHIASIQNRHTTLHALQLRGANLTLQNKKQQTAYDIAKLYKYVTCLPYCNPSYDHSTVEETIATQRQGVSKFVFRDIAFTYGDLIKKTSGQQPGTAEDIKFKQAMFKPQHTFKDAMIEKFGAKTASHFIQKAETCRLERANPATPAPAKKSTFKDAMIEKFGAKTASHFINKAEAAQHQKNGLKPNLKIISNPSLSFWSERRKKMDQQGSPQQAQQRAEKQTQLRPQQTQQRQQAQHHRVQAQRLQQQAQHRDEQQTQQRPQQTQQRQPAQEQRVQPQRLQQQAQYRDKQQTQQRPQHTQQRQPAHEQRVQPQRPQQQIQQQRAPRVSAPPRAAPPRAAPPRAVPRVAAPPRAAAAAQRATATAAAQRAERAAAAQRAERAAAAQRAERAAAAQRAAAPRPVCRR